MPILLPAFQNGNRHQLAFEAALESPARGAWVTIAEVDAAITGQPGGGAGRAS